MYFLPQICFISYIKCTNTNFCISGQILSLKKEMDQSILSNIHSSSNISLFYSPKFCYQYYIFTLLPFIGLGYRFSILGCRRRVSLAVQVSPKLTQAQSWTRGKYPYVKIFSRSELSYNALSLIGSLPKNNLCLCQTSFQNLYCSDRNFGTNVYFSDTCTYSQRTPKTLEVMGSTCL